MIEISALIRQIETYCDRHGIAETTFGKRAVNDGKLVQRLRDGKTIQIGTLNKVAEFLKRKPARVAA